MTVYTSRLPILAALLSLPLATACDINVNVGGESESETASASESESETASASESDSESASTTSTGGGSEESSTSTGGGSEESSTSTGGGSEESSSSEETGDDTPPGPGECSLILQDCGGGDRCSPRALDGEGTYDTVDCMPTAPSAAQEGDACNVEGSGLSGVNNCDVGLFCANVDPETNEGVCAQFCSHDGLEADCDDPFQTCVLIDGFFGICLSD
ncbi:MAG: hypothetical protein AAGA54_01420 [Myxococcota bacterium]